MNAPWQWWLGGVVAGGAFLLLLIRNLEAVKRSRQMLDGRPPTMLSRAAWLTSVFAAWTGPLIGVFSILGVVLGLVARRGQPNPRTRLSARMAIENGLVIALAVTALIALLYWGAV